MSFVGTFNRRLSRAKMIFNHQGFIVGLQYIFYYFLEDKWLLGRLVEMRGNSERLDNCTFNLDYPYIDTYLKSRFLIGSWEQEARYLFKKYEVFNLPVVEFGASIGIVSCIVNKLLETPSSHIVVEANTNLIPILEANKQQNNCQFKILNSALAYGIDEVSFYISERFNEGSVGKKTKTEITVRTTSLQQILIEQGFKNVNLVCDIEGFEVELAENEGDILSKHVEWIIVEVHGSEKTKKFRQRVEAQGFDLIEEFGHNHIYRNRHLRKT